MMFALPIITTIIAFCGLVLFVYLGTRRATGIQSVPRRKKGRINESRWLSEETFAAFVTDHDLEQPRNPHLFDVWVRSGTREIAAVTMKSGNQVLVSTVEML